MLTYLLQSCRLNCYVSISASWRHCSNWLYFPPVILLSYPELPLHLIDGFEIFLVLHFSSIAKIHFLLFVVINSSLLCCFFSISAFYSIFLLSGSLWPVLELKNERLFSYLLRLLCLEFLKYLNRNPIHRCKLLMYLRSPSVSVQLRLSAAMQNLYAEIQNVKQGNPEEQGNSTYPSCK